MARFKSKNSKLFAAVFTVALCAVIIQGGTFGWQSISGEGEVGIGRVVFDKPGVYVYPVYEMSGGVKGWS